ncbi:MAG TPA: alpha/beta hydrolase-fold protein [Puia sp.]|nr:alpha/beta hydrolase-fold protein [Puia sp.]
MKRLSLIFLLLSLISVSQAQYTLHLLVTTPNTPDTIYLAGNINSWDPAAGAYRLTSDGNGKKTLIIKSLPPGNYQFKFTRGSWNKVETNTKGEDIPNREIDLHRDTTLALTIDAWKDQFAAAPKHHTASAQVRILDTAFFIPQLHRYRRIWVYLPGSYHTGKNKHYPVLYMQDGQNLFDEQTASFGEWGIDECLDTLQQTTGRDCIIIGIDHGGDHRITEYDPYDNAQYGTGEGDAYAKFLVATLKPFIDSSYRTLKDPQHTYIAGSSLGALIALYAVMKYPRTFGAAGIFSPAFWIAPPLNNQLQHTQWNTPHRFYCYAGEKESARMTSDMDTVIDILKKYNEVFRSVNPRGQHSEKYWRQAFPAFYTWLVR